MKKNLSFIAVTVFLICISFSCHRYHHRNNLDVSVSESNAHYKLQAAYSEDRTGEVQRYINKQIEPNGIFSSSEDYFDINTELQDHTKFYIKSSPGSLEIRFNKEENSSASYERMKNICEGVAGILKEK